MIESFILSLVLLSLSPWRTGAKPKTPFQRPELVELALREGNNLYYFGLGSNMLRSKLENRGLNGSKIEILSIEPAYVLNYRLSFNLRGFLPIEPGMGSLEPIDSGSKALLAYERPECHGALVLLTPENYEKVMQSEGINPNATNPSYEEVVVEAFPYDSSVPVQAIALRARPHVRLRRDPAPSQRYMKILRDGAAELQLKPCYQAFLASHPTHSVPRLLRKIALYNFLFSFMLSSTFKTRIISRVQSWILYRFYVPTSGRNVLQNLSHFATAIILLPGALAGLILKGVLQITKKEPPAFWNRIAAMDKESEERT